MRIIVIDVAKGVETCQHSRGKPCTSDARFKIRKIRKTTQNVEYLCLKHYRKKYPMDATEYLAQLV